jgi:hypothetical protein
MSDGLVLWVIYKHPKDFPDDYVLRPHRSSAEGVEQFKVAAVSKTLKGVRDVLPPGLHNLGRQDGDDPVIFEVWV